MSTVVVKTTGGDVNVTPVTQPAQEFAAMIVDQVSDTNYHDDDRWLRLPTRNGYAYIKTRAVTAVFCPGTSNKL